MLVVLLVCGRAHAQSGSLEGGFQVGPSLETHDGDRAPAENTYKPGVSAGANLRYWLMDWFAIQAELLYATRGSDIELNGDSFNELSFSYLELPLLARIGWPRDSLRWQAHAIAGAAVSVLLQASDEVGDIPRKDLRELDVSLVAGLGGTYRFGTSWSVSVEARYDNGLVDLFPTQDDLKAENRAFLLMLSVDRVLHARDRDRDRFPDYRDGCPAVAGDRDGCPETVEPRVVDNDDDGIIGEKDKCPEQPEDENKYEDEDGCPDGDKDDDQDGLANAEDICPKEHFSLDRSLQYASIQDDVQKLKGPRGEEPGWTKAGCRILRTDGFRILLDPPIEFASGQEILPPSRYWILDEVARYLATNPGITLIVEGYADRETTGADDKRKRDRNKEESQKRADNVSKYLTETWQIMPSRLTPMGLGGTESSTEEGKRKSRRVEFRIR